jgi:hypothetical protein
MHVELPLTYNSPSNSCLIFFFPRLDDYDGKCQPSEYMPDGGVSIFPLNIGLVNGRGKSLSPQTNINIIVNESYIALSCTLASIQY